MNFEEIILAVWAKRGGAGTYWTSAQNDNTKPPFKPDYFLGRDMFLHKNDKLPYVWEFGWWVIWHYFTLKHIAEPICGMLPIGKIDMISLKPYLTFFMSEFRWKQNIIIPEMWKNAVLMWYHSLMIFSEWGIKWAHLSFILGGGYLK